MNGVTNRKQLTESDIQIINNWFATKSRMFRNATVGNHIATGGQAIVHYLLHDDNSTKFVIKVLYSKDNSEAERIILDKSFYKLKDINDRIVEAGYENYILRIWESFSIKIGDDEYLRGFVEKYTECLEKHEHLIEKNAQKQKCTEIAFHLGFDLLPLLQCFIDQADPKTGGAIYHRDIKPENIFLKKEDVSGGLCLGDFGIATHSNPERKPTTTKRIAAGTEYTMTHDIIMQDSKDEEFKNIDKSDMFSLGVTMYYYLNGCSYPFVTPFEKPQDVFSWLEERKKGCPKKLLFGSDELKKIVYKAIEFYPKDRFKSCKEMFEALKKTPEYKEFIEKDLSPVFPEQFIMPDKMCGKRLDERFALNSFVGINHIGILYRGYDEIDKQPVLIEIFDQKLYSSTKEQDAFKSKLKSLITSASNPVNVNHISCGNRFWYTVFKDTDVDCFNRFIDEFFEDEQVKEDITESTKEKELKKRCKILISFILLSVIIAFGSFFVILKRDIIPYIEETRSGTVVDAVDSSQYNLLEGTDDEIS